MQQVILQKKSNWLKLFYFVLFLQFFMGIQIVSFAQSVKGSWFGKGEVILAGENNNYLIELILKQKGSKIEGMLGYYYKNFYQTFLIHGKYNTKTREVSIKDFPIIYYNANSIENAVN